MPVFVRASKRAKAYTRRGQVKRIDKLRDRIFKRVMKPGLSKNRSHQLQSTYRKLGNKAFDIKMGNRHKVF